MEIGNGLVYAAGIVTTNWDLATLFARNGDMAIVRVDQLLYDRQAHPAPSGVPHGGSHARIDRKRGPDPVGNFLSLRRPPWPPRSPEETETLTVPPMGCELMALVRRLVSTWCSRFLSPLRTAGSNIVCQGQEGTLQLWLEAVGRYVRDDRKIHWPELQVLSQRPSPMRALRGLQRCGQGATVSS